MNHDKRDDAILYIQAMAFVLEMYKQRIINKEDYSNMEQFLAGRFKIDENSIYRINNRLD